MMATENTDTELELKDPPESEEADAEEKPEPIKEPADPNEVVEVKVTRDQKKRNRFREVEETARAANERAERAEREVAANREALARLQQHPQAPQQANPHVQRIQQIDQATDELHAHYQAVATRPGWDPNGPQQKEFERKARELQTARQVAVSQATAPQFDMREVARQVAWNNFTNEHSDVFSNQKAQDWAWGRYMQLVRGEGQADTKELAERILDEARVKHGMQPRNSRGSRPDVATQRRLSGVSAQANGGAPEVGVVPMGKHEKRMAEELYDNLDIPKEQKWQKWANGPGKRAMSASARK